MRVTVEFSDGGVLSGFRRTSARPFEKHTPGLIEARAMVAAPFAGTRLPRPQFGRVGVVAFWESDEAIDRHERSQVRASGGGWSARLEPIRAVPVAGGHYPGVPDDLPRSGNGDHDGPVAVITIARTKRLRTVPFFRANAPADRDVSTADGLLWGTGLANVPQGVMATFSLWTSGDAAHAYAVGTAGHRAAMKQEGHKSFHHRGSFIRFKPYAVTGRLDGRNPLGDVGV